MLLVPFCGVIAFLFVATARADVNARIEDYEGRQITAVAVSYTHLTLPTIYSV